MVFGLLLKEKEKKKTKTGAEAAEGKAGAGDNGINPAPSGHSVCYTKPAFTGEEMWRHDNVLCLWRVAAWLHQLLPSCSMSFTVTANHRAVKANGSLEGTKIVAAERDHQQGFSE